MIGGPIMGGAARITYDTTVNVVCDGNSLTAGDGGTPYPAQLVGLSPFNGVVPFWNVGVSGRTTGGMISAAAPDSHFVGGKKNILIAWEGTNTLIVDGVSGTVAAQQMATYIAQRKAANAWSRIVLLTCLPRQTNAGAAQTLDLNTRLDEYNAYLRGNYRAMGADLLVDIRAPGSVFNIPDYAMATFETFTASPDNWKAAETGNHTHLNTAGYAAIAQMVRAGLLRLRR